MTSILVPVDGSDNAMRAVDHALTLARGCAAAQVHLLNVREPVYEHVKDVMSREEVEKLEIAAGRLVLQPAQKMLDAAGVQNVGQVRIGPIADSIADYAREMLCNNIVMGTRGMGAIKSMLMGSVTTKVIHLVDIPVTLVK